MTFIFAAKCNRELSGWLSEGNSRSSREDEGDGSSTETRQRISPAGAARPKFRRQKTRIALNGRCFTDPSGYPSDYEFLFVPLWTCSREEMRQLGNAFVPDFIRTCNITNHRSRTFAKWRSSTAIRLYRAVAHS